ncbi:MAG: hypothetical protein QME48_08320 [bacterium]|uniref:Uncharacterized protein n=2 Tax=Bacteria candidate phyla TaxID=1783234 RepID=A0A101I1K9_UNCT6|nr:MAG: hypothetical protein XD76_0440 [candidate division TA06 bacterium 32_111]KUK87332.1 MAG: hypothetical protein XE03_0730 [candidate division TA06 bacterium 34_109]MDI6701212.1 hypothetical protein [bacterium]HAF07835.1 hypothetical protein [candidate division WOR-3 bacterium]HCP17353.1 hypothetical protein [candidate division WOR-3 bacterium]
MTKKIISIVLVFVYFSIFSNGIKIGFTDNLFKTNDNISDAVLSLEMNFKKNFEKTDIFFNFGMNTPFINNYYISFPSDLLYQIVFKDDMKTSLISGIYSYQNFYLNDFYRENNLLTPGIFIDFKRNFDFFYTLKNSFDLYYNCYPFYNTNSSAYLEILNKNYLYFPFNSSFHLYTKAGYKSKDGILLLNVTPLVSLNIFRFIGLSLSYNFQKVSSKTIDYHYDDSFLDDYSFDKNISLNGKITFQVNQSSKFVFSSTYENVDFLPLKHIITDSLFSEGEIENRTDKILHLGFNFIYSKEKNVYNINYEFIKKESTNSYYNFNSNTINFSFKF